MKYIIVFWSVVAVTLTTMFVVAYVAAHFLHKFW